MTKAVHEVQGIDWNSVNQTHKMYLIVRLNVQEEKYKRGGDPLYFMRKG
jgi:hypothetical protein